MGVGDGLRRRGGIVSPGEAAVVETLGKQHQISNGIVDSEDYLLTTIVLEHRHGMRGRREVNLPL